jgi:UDP-N-acetyl-D-mannosaminuronic acid dehydrogenase
VEHADAVLLLVNHSQFRSIEPSALIKLTPARMVFDTVNGWDREKFLNAGFKFYRLGDGKNIQ